MKEVFNTIWELELQYQDKSDHPGHAEVALSYATELVTLEKGNEDVVIPAIIHDVGFSQLPKERRLTVFSMDASDEDRCSVVFEHQNESIKPATKILRNLNNPDGLPDEILEIIPNIMPEMPFEFFISFLERHLTQCGCIYFSSLTFSKNK